MEVSGSCQSHTNVSAANWVGAPKVMERYTTPVENANGGPKIVVFGRKRGKGKEWKGRKKKEKKEGKCQ